MALKTIQFVFERGFQFFSRAIHGESDGLRFMRDCDGGMAFQPCFHHAALVLRAALFAVLVMDVYFHTSHVVTDMRKSVCDDGFSFSRKFLTARDVIVGIDLNDHGVWSCRCLNTFVLDSGLAWLVEINKYGFPQSASVMQTAWKWRQGILDLDHLCHRAARDPELRLSFKIPPDIFAASLGSEEGLISANDAQGLFLGLFQ